MTYTTQNRIILDLKFFILSNVISNEENLFLSYIFYMLIAFLTLYQMNQRQVITHYVLIRNI